MRIYILIYKSQYVYFYLYQAIFSSSIQFLYIHHILFDVFFSKEYFKKIYRKKKWKSILMP